MKLDCYYVKKANSIQTSCQTRTIPTIIVLAAAGHLAKDITIVFTEKKVHKMMDATITPVKQVNPSILPDEDNPDFYCKSCKFKYSNKGSYRYHLKFIHRMGLTSKFLPGPQYNPNIKEIDEKSVENTSCFIRELVFGTRKLYLNHRARHTESANPKSPLTRGKKWLIQILYLI